jgi:hypothetical protein
MGQLRERMEADLKLAGYNPKTQKIYLLHARRFARHAVRVPGRRTLLTAFSSGGPTR